MAIQKTTIWSYVMAIFLIFPLLNRIFDTGFLFLAVALILLTAEVLKGERKKFLTRLPGKRVICYGIFLAFFLFAFVRKAAGQIKAGKHDSGEFLVMVAVVILGFLMERKENWNRKNLQVPTFMGLWIMVLYLADTAFFPGALALFAQDTVTKNYINMLAYVLILMAAGLYMYADDKTLNPVYIAAMVTAALGLAVNEAWGAVFLTLFMLVIHSAVILPVAEVMKRLLQVFFGLAFLFCNMPLLVNYSGAIQIEGLKYSLECGVVGELLLCFLALYVFRRWEKIPEQIDLRRIKLVRLQRGCRFFLKSVSITLLPLTAVSLIAGRLGAEKLVQLFVEEKWEQMQGNIFIVTLISLFNNVSRALTELWSENIFALFYQMYGGLGIIIALSGVGALVYRLYDAVRKKKVADDFVKWLAAGVILALACLPVTGYMLPAYQLFVFWALCSCEADGAAKKASRRMPLANLFGRPTPGEQ